MPIPLSSHNGRFNIFVFARCHDCSKLVWAHMGYNLVILRNSHHAFKEEVEQLWLILEPKNGKLRLFQGILVEIAVLVIQSWWGRKPVVPLLLAELGVVLNFSVTPCIPGCCCWLNLSLLSPQQAFSALSFPDVRWLIATLGSISEVFSSKL